jgi:hypothetical protein
MTRKLSKTTVINWLYTENTHHVQYDEPVPDQSALHLDISTKSGISSMEGTNITSDNTIKQLNLVSSAGTHGTAQHAVKIILFYNSYFHWKDFRFGLGINPFIDKCGRSDCQTTNDHRYMDMADVVVFFGHYLPKPPKRAHVKQLFVFFNTEPPTNEQGAYLLGMEFNLTITYRHDSTIKWLYGLTLPKTEDDAPYEPLSARQVADKTRPVAWMVSRCNRKSTIRMEYAAELQKYIAVDIFGACGNYTCPRKDLTCMDMLQKKYKFYLAFENSICEDYITEKTFRTLLYNIVPVVMGGGNYSRDLPPNSFIHASDFDSPRHLASYLHYLDRNPQEYLKYFQWKLTEKIQMENYADMFCSLCAMLHDQHAQYYVNFNVSNWWRGNHCIWMSEREDKMIPMYHLYDS